MKHLPNELQAQLMQESQGQPDNLFYHAAKQIQEDSVLIATLAAVVEDFLPNIGQCALQNYGRLNEALIASKRRLE